MAKAVINLQKESGGIVKISPVDGIGITEVTFPESGELATKEYADLKQSKSELAYNVNTSSYISNTLSSGAIIERGSNSNGEYIKYADGTLICIHQYVQSGLACTTPSGTIFTTASQAWTFPYLFIDGHYSLLLQISATSHMFMPRTMTLPAGNFIDFVLVSPNSTTFSTVRGFLCAIGRWK